MVRYGGPAGWLARWTTLIATIVCAGPWPTEGAADTFNRALVDAYRSNPTLDAQRSGDPRDRENVPIVLGGYRPKVSATSSISEAYLDNLTRVPRAGFTSYSRQTGENAVSSFGVTGTQTLFMQVGWAKSPGIPRPSRAYL